jgi:hypothetical protein
MTQAAPTAHGEHMRACLREIVSTMVRRASKAAANRARWMDRARTYKTKGWIESTKMCVKNARETNRTLIGIKREARAFEWAGNPR